MGKIYSIGIRNFIITLLLLGSFTVLGQQGNNPFDITTRKPATEKATSVSTPTPSEETISETEIIIEEQETAIDTSTSLSTPVVSTPILDGNPFTVSRPKPGSKKKVDEKEKSNIAKIKKTLEKAEKIISPNLLFWVITGLLLLLTLSVTLYGSYISKVYRAFLNENFLKMIQRDQGTVGAVPYLILYGLFFISAGVFLFLVLQHFKLNFFSTSFTGLLSYIGIVTAIFLLKHLVLNIVAYVFPIYKEIKQYSFTIIIFSIMLGLILIPANVFIAYAPPEMANFFIYGTFIAILSLYLFRAARSLFIVSRLISLHMFHFFMYLCTLEIAPLIVLVKLILLKSTEL